MKIMKRFSAGEVVDVTEDSKMDYCKVHLKPSRDMDLEYFSSPASLIAALQIDFEHDKEVGKKPKKRLCDTLCGITRLAHVLSASDEREASRGRNPPTKMALLFSIYLRSFRVHPFFSFSGNSPSW